MILNAILSTAEGKALVAFAIVVSAAAIFLFIEGILMMGSDRPGGEDDEWDDDDDY